MWAVLTYTSVILFERRKKLEIDEDPDPEVHHSMISISNIQEEKEDSELIVDLKRTTACLYSSKFWQYFALMILSQMFGGYFSYVFKQIGLANHIKDSYLTWAASAASIV